MNVIKINIWNKNNELNKKLREINKEEIDKAVKNFFPIFWNFESKFWTCLCILKIKLIILF